MIGNILTDKDGFPIDAGGNKLSLSSYNPPDCIKKLFARCQDDYNRNWRLQHRPFREFDGYSLLQRSQVDQETFGAYVGISQNPANKQWRWKGRKNTARNKVIGILAHLLAGMLFPYCYAYNDADQEDKMTANVMRILIENHLKKADYEMKFLFMVTSALVNPAVFCEVEYVEAMQRIKTKMADGSYKVEEAIDDLLSGINLNIIPIDQILLGDFYTFDVQRQPNIVRVKRIAWDEAREIYAGKFFIDGKDQFDFVEKGKTRVLMAGQEHQTLYDIEWTEADQNYVQESTFYYRPEDLEVTFVGGVFMGNYDEKDSESVYNSNPFTHRRMSMIGDQWKSIPVYKFAKSGFEPLDPTGRFAYYKSACFKEFWDDAAQNKMHQLAYDGTYLDVIKPLFMSGVAKIDSTVMVPGATIGMPSGATVTPYSLGPNLMAALNMMNQEVGDMSESTQDKIQSGITAKGITAYATSKAEQNAQVILGVFGVMIANLIKEVGELVIDDIIMHTTVGEVDATIPESLNMKYKKIISKGKEQGKDITNKIEFTTELMNITKKKADDLEWKMFDEAGGVNTSQRNYKVNPYKFARTVYSIFIDPSMIISRSMGTDQLRKERAFNLLMDPRVMPFINPEAVVDKFVLEDFSDGDPDEFKAKNTPQAGQTQGQQPNNQLLQSIMGQGAGQPQTNQQVPAMVGQ